MRSVTPFLLCAVLFSASAAEWHVRPEAPAGGDGSAARPFATPEAARDAARAVAGREPVRLVLHAGVYRRTAPLVLTAADSGSAAYPVEWVAAPGESAPVFTGAVRLTGTWSHPDAAGVRRLKFTPGALPSGAVPDELYVNGARRTLARYPNLDPKAKVFGGTAADCIAPERVARWADPAGGYFHAMHAAHWGGFSWRILGKNPDGKTLRLEGGRQGNRPSGPHPTDRYVEGVREELDAPGEWFARADELHYLPLPGESPETAVVEAAVASSLLEFRGAPGAPVRHVRWRGVTFTGTARTFMATSEPLLRTDWTIARIGAALLAGTEDCALESCDFAGPGGNAVMISGYNRRAVVRDCHIRDAGAGGVTLVGDPAAVRSPLFAYDKRHKLADIDLAPGPKTDAYPADCLVENCLIQRTGRVEKQSAGVGIDMAARITVRHCTIHDLPRAGINIGDGCWGGHLVEYCDIFDTVKETGDHGSFNSWGRDRFWGLRDAPAERLPELAKLDAVAPNTLRHSRWRCDHGWDIDLDDGSSNYEIYGNLLLNGGLKLREGFHRKVHDNIIVNNGLHPHVWYPHCGDEVRNNLLMAAHAPAVMPAGVWPGVVDRNFFAHEEDRVRHAGAGVDAHSRAGDPGFVDAAKGDFRLRADSPARAFGVASPDAPVTYGVTSPRLKAHAGSPELPKLKVRTRAAAGAPAPFTWAETTLRGIAGEEFSAFGVTRDGGGLVVVELHPFTPAGRAGLVAGDLIRTVNGAPTPDRAAFLKAAGNGKTPLKIGIVRDQAPREIDYRP